MHMSTPRPRRVLALAMIGGLALAWSASPSPAQNRGRRGRSLAERRVEALLRSKSIRFTFGDDGLMTCLGGEVPEVEAIVALGQAVIPALIAHLDDPRELPTSYMYANYGDRSVTLGMACADILASIVADRPPVFTDPGCQADGVRDCLADDFHVDVEDFEPTKTGYRPSRRLRDVKRRWERAYRAGQITFAGCPPPAE